MVGVVFYEFTASFQNMSAVKVSKRIENLKFADMCSNKMNAAPLFILQFIS